MDGKPKMTIPKLFPQMQPDGTFLMVDPCGPMVEADLSRLSMAQIAQFVEKKKAVNPNIEFWIDGDKKVLMSKVKA